MAFEYLNMSLHSRDAREYFAKCLFDMIWVHLLTSKSHQFLFVFNCTEVAKLVKCSKEDIVLVIFNHSLPRRDLDIKI